MMFPNNNRGEQLKKKGAKNGWVRLLKINQYEGSYKSYIYIFITGYIGYIYIYIQGI